MIIESKNIDVGLLTWHYATNIGSNLQAYAMQFLVENANKNCAFLNYRAKAPADSGIRKLTKTICGNFDSHFGNVLPERFRVQAYHFQNKKLKMTKPLSTFQDLRTYSEMLQCIICGSDQIWAPNVYDPVYQLTFCQEGTRKCAYAASVGLPEIPKSLVPEYRTNLRDFYYITVREKQGAELLSNILEREIPWVLDPTLLVPQEEWKNLARNVKTNGQYLFCYFLGNNRVHREMAQQYAKQNGLEIICCSDHLMDKSYFRLVISHMGPQEFLGFIRDCTAVFTDSFHGILFSIIFEKSFLAVHRFTDDDRICQNSRVDNILGFLNLENRCLLDGKKTFPVEPIDYYSIEKRLEGKRIESKFHFQKMLLGMD